MKYICCLVLLLQAVAHPSHHTLQLHGNYTLGYYFVQVGVGTPAQPEALIVDTGSNILAVPCKGCTHCSTSHLHQPFNVNASSTSSYVSCQNASQEKLGGGMCSNCNRQPTALCNFHISYTQGSVLQGMVVRDFLEFGVQDQRMKTVFGCTLSESNQFIEQKADGILGLTPSREHNLLEELFKQHTGVSQLGLSFGLCLAEDGGKLVLGGINPKLVEDYKPVVVGFTFASNLYSMQLKAIQLGDLHLSITSGDLGHMKMFVDSGATFSYFPARFYNQLAAQIINVAASLSMRKFEDEGDLCFKTANEEAFQTYYQQFVNLSLQFEGGTVLWEPSSYFIQYRETTDTKCLGFMSYDRFLLGTSWLVGRYVHFDLQKLEITIHKGKCSDPPSQAQNKTALKAQPAPEAQILQSVLHNQTNLAIAVAICVGVLCLFCPFLLCRATYTEQQTQIQHQQYQAAATVEDSHEVMQLAHGS